MNMQGVVDAFGASYLLSPKISPILNLDLEPESGNPQYVMSQSYYEKWAAAVTAGFQVGGRTIPFRPAVYLNMGDSQTSIANLNAACTGGAACTGISVAHYVHQTTTGDPDLAPPLPFGSMVWNAADVTPQPSPLARIPVLVWQYYGDFPKTKLANGDKTAT
jgi:hypothetical protein